jgi:hypothetical protein
MSTRVASLLGTAVVALTIGVAGCDLFDEIIDDIKNPPAQKCGAVTCGSGQVCCNASCGICTPPGGVCTQQVCDPPVGQCRADADCRAFSFMCTGCDCLALGPSEPEPVCPGPGVMCFADPCLNKKAVCQAGRCAIASATSCGAVTCPAGEVCCNASCGICTPPGGACTQQICESPTCGAGEVRRTVCLACGIAGGCAEEASCARTCTQDSQCTEGQTRCIAGLCQVQGCI